MLSAQLSGALVGATMAAGDPSSALVEGPYGWIGGLLVFTVGVVVFIRNAVQTLRQPAAPAATVTAVHMEGPLEAALKSLQGIEQKVAELPVSERRMIELREHFAAAVETTRKNFYLHVSQNEAERDAHDRETDLRVRALEQKVAVLESQRRPR